MNLPAELINRLIALKSLLDVGDLELVAVASSRLGNESENQEIAEILGALADHRYADSANLIERLLSHGTRLARWVDPEFALLKAELERVSAELADLETEYAELEQLVSRFHAAHSIDAEMAKRFIESPCSVDLSKPKLLDDDAAEILSKHKGPNLILSGLLALSDTVAESLLSKFQGELILDGLTSLSDATAEALSKNMGGLSLNGLHCLNSATAKILSKHGTWFPFFKWQCSDPPGQVISFSASAAITLSKYRFCLELNGLTRLSDEAAEYLSNHKGRQLHLNGLTTLSDQVAESISKHCGELYLDGLTHLNDKAIKWLSEHRGALISLNGLTTLSDTAADALSKYRGELIMDGLTSLSDMAAQSLSKYDGSNLSIKGLASLIDKPSARTRQTKYLEDTDSTIHQYADPVGVPEDGSSVLSEIISRTVDHNETSQALEVPERLAGDEQEFEIAPRVKIVMCWIPPGAFLMGSPENEFARLPNEKQHWVTISRGFWLGKFQVTQAQWEGVMGGNSNYIGSNLPIENISWNDISQPEGFLDMVNRYVAANNIFSLPTEAQWEYACRAGTLSALNSGKNLTSKTESCPNLDEIAWYHKNSGGSTHPVGEKKANAWGLHDMQGNVWEWCADCGDYVGGPLIDPRRPDSSSCRVFRGGSRRDAAFYCRVAVRENYPTTYRDRFIGFRLARCSAP